MRFAGFATVDTLMSGAKLSVHGIPVLTGTTGGVGLISDGFKDDFMPSIYRSTVSEFRAGLYGSKPGSGPGENLAIRTRLDPSVDDWPVR